MRVDSVDGECARSWRDGNRVEWWLSVMLVVVHRRPPIVTSRSQGFFFFRGNIRLLLAETVQWTEKERERERGFYRKSRGVLV